MPQDVSRVQVSVRTDTMTCELDLRAGSDRVAELTASGGNVTTVSGLFHELVRELEGKQLPGTWVARHIDSFPVYLALAIVASLGVYSLFDLPLDLASEHIPGFKGSTLHTTIGTIGWMCVAVTLMGGGILLHDRIKALFPAVQFSGHLTDPSSRQRRVVTAMFLVILLPILLNVLANFLTDLLNLWRAV